MEITPRKFDLINTGKSVDCRVRLKKTYLLYSILKLTLCMKEVGYPASISKETSRSLDSREEQDSRKRHPEVVRDRIRVS